MYSSMICQLWLFTTYTSHLNIFVKVTEFNVNYFKDDISLKIYIK